MWAWILACGLVVYLCYRNYRQFRAQAEAEDHRLRDLWEREDRELNALAEDSRTHRSADRFRP